MTDDALAELLIEEKRGDASIVGTFIHEAGPDVSGIIAALLECGPRCIDERTADAMTFQLELVADHFKEWAYRSGNVAKWVKEFRESAAKEKAEDDYQASL